MALVDQLISKAKKLRKRVVFPEGEDERIRQAAKTLAERGIVRPILLGEKDRITNAIGGPQSDGITIIDPGKSVELSRYSAAYAGRREGITVPVARRLIKRPLFFGAAMVREGDADAAVAGATMPTARVISAGALAIGFEKGVRQASSFFILLLEGEAERVLIYADSAVAVDPTSNELAQIAVITARNAGRLLDIEPRIAMLSFSTHGSADHPRVEKVREATRIARKMAPDLKIDGEIQLDAAISPGVSKKKSPKSFLKGEANVLIFPDLDSGNIAYKLTQYLAGAKAIGPVMQGFRRPINDLSRGASVEDIVALAAISAIQAEGMEGEGKGL